jgi:hypothetical protein
MGGSMKTFLKWLALAAILGAGPVHAQTFNLFKPANGILKGSTSTYVTSAAANTDVIGLWSGTADSSHCLSGAGTLVSCSGGGGSPGGSNTQVQFNSSGSFGASSNFTYNSGSNILQLGGSTTPGQYSVGVPDSMTISGASLPVPGYAINSNIQGLYESHSFTSSPTLSAWYYGVRARGTQASPSAAASGDYANSFLGAIYDGTNYDWVAHIHLGLDASPSTNVSPGFIDMQVTPAASNTPVSVLKLDHFGAFYVNGSAGTAGNCIVSGGAGVATSWASCGGGGGSPGGSNTQVQYNASGSFAGDANFTWTTGSQLLTLNSSASGLTEQLQVKNTSGNPGIGIYESAASSAPFWITSVSSVFEMGMANGGGVLSGPAFLSSYNSSTRVINYSRIYGGGGSNSLGVEASGEISVSGSNGTSGQCIESQGTGTQAHYANCGAVFSANTSATSAASIAVGQQYCVAPTSTQSITSSTTYTTDTAMSFTSIPVGRYKFDLTADWTYTASTGGVKAQVTFVSGTGTGPIYSGVANCNQAAATFASSENSSAGFACTGTPGSDAMAQAAGYFTVTGSANVALQWAQNSSNGTATVRDSVGQFCITRVN